MRAKCLVTGASGLLGREVQARLADRYDVLGLSHRTGGDGFVPIDLRDAEQVRGLVSEFPPDVVVHCAAYRDPDFCEKSPEETRRLNVYPARLLCDILPRETRFVFISSDYVFDGESPPYREEDSPSPVNVYGTSKVEAEQCVLGREHGLVVRTPLLVGAGPTFERSGFVAQAVVAARGRNRLELDNVLVRFPTWTRDVARAIDFLLAGDAEGIYQVSGPQGGTKFSWTVQAARILEEPVEHLVPSSTVVRRTAARPPNSELAVDKIKALGFGEFTSFQEVVVNVLEALGEA